MRRTSTRPTRQAPLLLAPAGFVLVLVLVVTHWPPLRRLDLTVAEDLNSVTAPHPALVTFWKVVSEVGQPATFQVLAVLTAVVLWRRRQVTTALFTAFTVVLAGLLSNVVKWSVRRDRPTVAEPLAHAAGTSFPSGHALSSIVGVTVLLLVLAPALVPALAPRHRPAAVVAGVLIVLAIGASRLSLGVHYLSDVTAGWLLGLTWVVVAHSVTRLLTARARPAPSSAAPDPLRGTRAG